MNLALLEAQSFFPPPKKQGSLVTHSIHGTRTVYLPTWMVDFYEINVGKSSSHGCVMDKGISWLHFRKAS